MLATIEELSAEAASAAALRQKAMLESAALAETNEVLEDQCEELKVQVEEVGRMESAKALLKVRHARAHTYTPRPYASNTLARARVTEQTCITTSQRPPPEAPKTPPHTRMSERTSVNTQRTSHFLTH
jgi:hypothetical protein